MALIVCPERGKNISDKASACPHCGLPAEFFVKKSTTIDTKYGRSTSNTGLPNTPKDVNLQNLGNILVSFDKDYVALFNQNHYVSSREKNGLIEVYGLYYKYLKDKYVFGYVCNHVKNLRVDIDGLKRFLTRMHHLENDTEVHNTAFVDQRLIQDKEYFDHIFLPMRMKQSIREKLLR